MNQSPNSILSLSKKPIALVPMAISLAALAVEFQFPLNSFTAPAID